MAIPSWAYNIHIHIDDEMEVKTIPLAMLYDMLKQIEKEDSDEC